MLDVVFAKHASVNHSVGEYVSLKNPAIHTNTIEGYFYEGRLSALRATASATNLAFKKVPMGVIKKLVLECVIEEQEIRAVTYEFDGGPVAGYEWRLRVTYQAGPKGPRRAEWLPWVFGSHQSVQKMLKQWEHYSILSEAKPDSPVQ